jgi:hypothetical protein
MGLSQTNAGGKGRKTSRRSCEAFTGCPKLSEPAKDPCFRAESQNVIILYLNSKEGGNSTRGILKIRAAIGLNSVLPPGKMGVFPNIIFL